MILPENQRKLLLISALAFSLTACSTLSRQEQPEMAPEGAAEAKAVDPLVTAKNAQIQSLQAQVNELQTQLKSQPVVPTLQPRRQNFDASVSASIARNDPQRGFVNDANVQAFRQGKILFDSEKFPEAVLAFSALIERSPTHPLAGVAQFYLAESYFSQGDLESAKVEYQKLIQHYDRSPHIAEAYARQAQCLAQQGNPQAANQLRQKVIAFFPRSEAAALVANEFPMIAKVAEPVPPTPPAPPTVQLETPRENPLNNPSALDDVPVTAPESGDQL